MTTETPEKNKEIEEALTQADIPPERKELIRKVWNLESQRQAMKEQFEAVSKADDKEILKELYSKYTLLQNQIEQIHVELTKGKPVIHVKHAIKTEGEVLYERLEHLHNNPDDHNIDSTKRLLLDIGKMCYEKDGFKNMKLTFESVAHKLAEKYNADFDKYRALWNGICDEWKY